MESPGQGGRAARLGSKLALFIRVRQDSEGVHADGEVDLTNPSSTSVVVGEVMAKRVVVVVLALVFLTPALTYFAPDTSNLYALD